MNKRVAIVLMVFMLLPLVLSLPPVLQVSDPNGITIQYPKYYYIPKDTPFNLDVHSINLTSILTNDTTDCFIDIYNQSGDHITENWMEWEEESMEWEITITAGNFSSFGIYSYIIGCNSSSQAGFVGGNFEVNKDGIEPPTNSLAVFFFSGFILFIMILPTLFIINIALMVEKDFNMKHLIYNMSAYFGLFAFYFIVQNYFRNSFVQNMLLFYIEVGGFTNIFFPVILFIISITLWKWEDAEKW